MLLILLQYKDTVEIRRKEERKVGDNGIKVGSVHDKKLKRKIFLDF